MINRQVARHGLVERQQVDRQSVDFEFSRVDTGFGLQDLLYGDRVPFSDCVDAPLYTRFYK